MTTTQQQDVVDLLLRQHEQIKALFNQIAGAGGVDKRERFEELVRLLAVHESAEEEVVHPAARRKIDRGDQVVGSRLQEEHQAKHALAELYDLGIDHPDFDRKLATLAEAVTQHAEREEREEFQRMREKFPADQLQTMAKTVQAAQSLAPTRPHPRIGESQTANLLVGPPLSVFDRIRDKVRDSAQAQRG